MIFLNRHNKVRLRIAVAAVLVTALLAFPLFVPADIAAATLDEYDITHETAESAMELTPGDTIKGSLINSNTTDWYRVTIPTKGKLRFSLGSNGLVYPTFYTNMSAGYGDSYPNARGDFVSPYYRLPAGTYYLQLVSGTMAEGKEVVGVFYYSLSVEFVDETGTATETEWNTTKEEATPLEIGKTITGNLTHGNDVDWYRVSVPKRGALRLRFTRDASISGDYIWTIVSGGKSYPFKLAKSVKKNTILIPPVSLNAGTAYIKIASTDGYPNTDDYKLKAEFFPGEGNAKLKKTAVSAGKLSPGFSAGETAYKLKLPGNTASVRITAQAASARAKVAVKNGGSFKTAKNVTVKLNKGQTKTVTIRVTAEDKVTVKTYTIKVSRAK